MMPLRLSSTLSKPATLAFWPMAAMTQVTGRTSNLPGTGTGRRRPDSSGSPSSMTWSLISLTFPFSPMISAGVVRNL